MNIKTGNILNWKKEKKVILKNISGIFEKGKLNVIMGASGSGKTSLLNILGMRVDKKNVKGIIEMNKKQYDLGYFSSICGYVMQ